MCPTPKISGKSASPVHAAEPVAKGIACVIFEWLQSHRRPPPQFPIMKLHTLFAAALAVCLTGSSILAGEVIFFDNSQVAVSVSSETTSDTISSEGYLFTYTRDKLFTGGVGMTIPIGRTVRVPWPQGIEAQAVTTGPSLSGGQITIKRVDGGVFDLTSFTGRLLANTAATGAQFEIMPTLDGEDAFNDPIFFDASGYYGNTFSYDANGGYLGSTALLTGYDTYKIALFCDFAVTSLTLDAAAVPEPSAFALLGLGTLTLVCCRFRIFQQSC